MAVPVLFQTYVIPATNGALNTTFPPVQKVVAPPAVIAAVGEEGAVNVPFNIFDAHPAELVNVILYVPLPKSVIDVGKLKTGELPLEAPVHDKVPVPDPFTSIAPLFVAQDVGSVNVPKVIAGIGLTVTTVAADVAEQPLEVTVTVYDPAVVAV
jgi:hypothetical protein